MKNIVHVLLLTFIFCGNTLAQSNDLASRLYDQLLEKIQNDDALNAKDFEALSILASDDDNDGEPLVNSANKEKASLDEKKEISLLIVPYFLDRDGIQTQTRSNNEIVITLLAESDIETHNTPCPEFPELSCITTLSASQLATDGNFYPITLDITPGYTVTEFEAVWPGLNLSNTLGVTIASTCGDGYSGFLDLTVLPVELLEFSVKERGISHILNWTTITEVNNEGFDILYSTDGNEFSSLGFVRGEGTTYSETKYDFSHTPVSYSEYSYYVLDQKDSDGRTSKSPMISIHNTSEAISIHPISGNRIEISGGTAVQVTSIDGKILFSKVIVSSEEKMIIPAMFRGLIFVSVSDGNHFVTKKISMF